MCHHGGIIESQYYLHGAINGMYMYLEKFYEKMSIFLKNNNSIRFMSIGDVSYLYYVLFWRSLESGAVLNED
jgi:hypothetical protein